MWVLRFTVDLGLFVRSSYLKYLRTAAFQSDCKIDIKPLGGFWSRRFAIEVSSEREKDIDIFIEEIEAMIGRKLREKRRKEVKS